MLIVIDDTDAELKRAVENKLKNNQVLLSLVRKKVPLFGLGSDEAEPMANRIVKWAYDYYVSIPHYWGRKNTTGF